MGIQTYRLEVSGEGLDFFPNKTEISVGAVDERKLSLHVFSSESVPGLRDFRLHVTSPSTKGLTVDMPMRVLFLPRGRTAVWSADLDGDGSPEWVLENQKIRAVFSSQDGGRWMEFTWKATNTNFLPEQGLLAGAGHVEARVTEGGVEFTGPGFRRTVTLAENALTIEQGVAVPPGPTPGKHGNATLTIDHPSPNRAVYTIR